MMLNDVIKRLKDMELLYGKAILTVDVDGKEYTITSIDGFAGERRVGECNDPNRVVIKTKPTFCLKNTARSIIHPEWIPFTSEYLLQPRYGKLAECPICGRTTMDDEKFCSNCGARMEVEE